MMTTLSAASRDIKLDIYGIGRSPLPFAAQVTLDYLPLSVSEKGDGALPMLHECQQELYEHLILQASPSTENATLRSKFFDCNDAEKASMDRLVSLLDFAEEKTAKKATGSAFSSTSIPSPQMWRSR